MGGEIDRPVDRDGEVRVDLDQAPVAALVPVVGGPGLTVHVLEREALLGGEGDARARPVAAGGDGGAEGLVQAVARDDEGLAERLVPLRERPLAREQTLKARMHLAELGLRDARRDGVVERLGLLVEAHLPARDEVHPGQERVELAAEHAAARARQGVFLTRGDAVQLLPQLGAAPAQVGERPLRLRGRGLPVVRAVVGVHGRGVVLSHGEHQLHVVLRHDVQVAAVGRRVGPAAGRGGQGQESQESGLPGQEDARSGVES